MNQNNTDKRKYIPWIFIPCVLAFVIQIVITIIVMEGGAVYALGSFKGNTFDELISYVYDTAFSTATNGLIYLLYSVIGIIVFFSIYHSMFMKDSTYSLRGKSKNLPATLAGVVLFCVGMQYVSMYLVSALSSAFPAWLEEYEQLLESAGLEGELSPLMALYALLLGPIVEEIVFRGITLSAAKKVMPYYLAIVVQALLFGAFHMNVIQSSYAFVLGLGLGYIMHLYDNIFITLLIHVGYNIIGTVGATYLPTGGDTLISFFFWVLFALIISYAGIILLKKGAASVKEEENYADI